MAGWCSVLHMATVRGLGSHPLYNTQRSMMQRCYDEKSNRFQYYGGRGITVCPEWHDARSFIAWIEANLGPRPDGMTLDRIDNDGNYEPGNVRWATSAQQALNKRPRDRKPADEVRSERFSVSVTPTLLAMLDAYAAEHRWTRSTAAAVLIEQALAAPPPGWDYVDPAGEPQ